MATIKKDVKDMIPIINCGGATGKCVVYGYVERFPDVGEQVNLHNARMILKWGNPGLFDLAVDGPKNDTRLTPAVKRVTDVCRQALTVSTAAAEAIDKKESHK